MKNTITFSLFVLLLILASSKTSSGQEICHQQSEIQCNVSFKTYCIPEEEDIWDGSQDGEETHIRYHNGEVLGGMDSYMKHVYINGPLRFDRINV